MAPVQYLAHAAVTTVPYTTMPGNKSASASLTAQFHDVGT